MADNSTTAAAHPAIPLMANSYNFQALLKASEHAEGLKTDDGQAAAFGVIPKKHALNQDVIAGQGQPAVPEGTKIAKIEDAQGRLVNAPIAMPAEKEPDAAPPPPPPPPPPSDTTKATNK